MIMILYCKMLNKNVICILDDTFKRNKYFKLVFYCSKRLLKVINSYTTNVINVLKAKENSVHPFNKVSHFLAIGGRLFIVTNRMLLYNWQSNKKCFAFSSLKPQLQRLSCVKCRLNKSEFKSLIRSLNLQCKICGILSPE